MKKLVLTAVLLVAGITTASADVGAGLVGNTVTLTGPDGAITKIFYSDASSLVVKTTEGAEIPGSWRVDGDKICTVAGDAPENCTPSIAEAPNVGSSGSIEGEAGAVAWAVTAGRDF